MPPLGYGFEGYFLDPDRRELRRGDDLVPVEPQVFDLLQYLIENRDRVVSKDDLIAGVWNGRIVSDSALSSRITAARHAIGDTGEAQRLIRTVPRKGLRFVGEVRDDKSLLQSPSPPMAASALVLALPLPDKPSIAVLPFANLSGDPAQDYFADGMVEDITIALGRLPWLFVIGSSSALTYKNRSVDLKQIGNELGVRYALRGSVRKEGNRVRIAVQLLDTSHGGQIWANSFDAELESIFDLQDRVAAQVRAAISPALQSVEIERARQKPTENLTAYDLYLRASSIYRDGYSHSQEALHLLRRAIDLDPKFGAAYGLAAWCHDVQKVYGWVPARGPTAEDGIRMARLAAEIGRADSEALWMAARALLFLAADFDEARPLAHRAVSLNPNSPNAWWACGSIEAFAGDPDLALEYFERSRRLSPSDPLAFGVLAGMAIAHFFAGRYRAAAAAAEQSLRERPKFPPALRLKVTTSALLDRLDEAHEYLPQLLEVNPDATVQALRTFYEQLMRRKPGALELYLKGLRLAGLPEG